MSNGEEKKKEHQFMIGESSPKGENNNPLQNVISKLLIFNISIMF